MVKKSLSILLLVVFLVTGCTAKTAQPPAVVSGDSWPTRGWQVSTPEKQGLDPAMLKKMQAAIKEKAVNLHSLLIIRNGAIVSETYYGSYRQNTKHPLYSVTKSFISTLVGIAFDRGKLTGVNQRVLDLLPGRSFANDDPRKQAMTLENLLTMNSGLEWTESDPTYVKMYQSQDWVKMVMDAPMQVDPGSKFQYCSGCTHVLSAIVQQATATKTYDFAQENLFKPLGITNLEWETDRQGIVIGGWGLSLTPRDMAKLGYLYLHNGSWEGKQIVSSSWVQAATVRHTDTDPGSRLGYGYQWWIYPTHGAYAALGRYGQTIFVAPDLNLIVVTTAELPEGHDPIFELIDNYILPAVIE